MAAPKKFIVNEVERVEVDVRLCDGDQHCRLLFERLPADNLRR